MKEIKQKINIYLKGWKPPKKGDDDDLVDTDTDQETNNEESEEMYWIEESKKIYLESGKSETDKIYQRKHPELLKILDSQKTGDMITLLLMILIWNLM